MTLLSPYRVLDLTDQRGQIAGLMLADLGAEVLRIEPPEGSGARRVGPMLGEGLGVSLSFAAYNQNKRSVVLDLNTDAGREQLLALVASADFLIDSGAPAALDDAGLGHDRLRKANPQLVHVRVSAFGTDGPLAEAPAADLTIAALGGPVALQGHADRAPVRLSVPQVWRHAGAEAALAALVGHARMRTTGEGVFVDVSAQAAMVWTTLQAAEAFAIQGWNYERAGSELQLGKVGIELVHPCKDGFVVAAAIGRMFLRLEPWLLQEGAVSPDFHGREDWETYDRRMYQDEELAIPLAEITEMFRAFFATKTKDELFYGAREHNTTIAPVKTMDDLLGFVQLAERDYFRSLQLPDGQQVKTPGPFVKSTGFTHAERTPAPRLGQHTDAVLAELVDTPPKAPVHVANPKDLPLAGIKVADFSWVGVGPITAKVLADHGAEVIRIESEHHPDVLRAAGPYRDGEPGWNRSHFYGEFNTSKRSLCMSMKHERTAEIMPTILGWADVVLESFTPGAIARLGAGYEVAREINPGIIMASTCLLGQTGSLSNLAGYGYHAAALAGFTALTGDADRPPTGPWNAYTDTVAPRFLATSIMAALDHRERTGEGQRLDLAQMEAALHFLAPELLATQASGARFERNGSRSRDAAPQGVYPCAGQDEWCAVAVESDEQWAALASVIGAESNAAWATAADRLAAHDKIDAIIAAWTSSREPRQVMAELLAAGVPAGHVQRSSDLLQCGQLAHREFHRTFDHAEMGPTPYSGHAYRISGYDNGPRHAAPLLGGDTFDILTETLGFSPEQVVDWMAAGALE